jgi:hypothetical protein
MMLPPAAQILPRSISSPIMNRSRTNPSWAMVSMLAGSVTQPRPSGPAATPAMMKPAIAGRRARVKSTARAPESRSARPMS